MPGIKKRCEYCNKNYWASRIDSIFCSEKCRGRNRFEEAKFKYPLLPKSNITGITFNRLRGRWEIKIRVDNKLKYVGCKSTLHEAIIYKKELEQ